MKLKDHFEVERFEHSGFTCVVYQDPEPPDPREWDNLATLACWRRRDKLGDEQIDPGTTAREIVKTVRDRGDRVLAIMPLWLYQHSGMSLRASDASPFTCRFDSGQVGWAYVTRSQVEKLGCAYGIKDRATLKDAIRSEVGTYDDYINGRCYGYEVLDADGDHIDSCWGYYIGKAGIEEIRQEARSAAEGAKPLGWTPSRCNVTCEQGVQS